MLATDPVVTFLLVLVIGIVAGIFRGHILDGRTTTTTNPIRRHFELSQNRAFPYTNARSYLRTPATTIGIGFQERVSNQPELLRSKDVVVGVG